MLIVSKVFDFRDNVNTEMGINILKGFGLGEDVYDMDDNVIGKYKRYWLEGTCIMAESEITEEWAVDKMLDNCVNAGKIKRAKLLASAQTDEEADKLLESVYEEVEKKYAKLDRLSQRKKARE